jgi:hypothetical protein
MSTYLTNLVMRTIEPVVSVQPRLAPLFGPVSDEQHQPLAEQMKETKDAFDAASAEPLALRPSSTEGNAFPQHPTRSFKDRQHFDQGESEEPRPVEKGDLRPRTEILTNPIADPAKTAEQILGHEPVKQARVEPERALEPSGEEAPRRTPPPQFREGIVERERPPQWEQRAISPVKITAAPSESNAESRNVVPAEQGSRELEDSTQEPSLVKGLNELRRDVQRLREQFPPLPVKTSEEQENVSLALKPSDVRPSEFHEIQEGRRSHDFETRVLRPRLIERTREEQLSPGPEPTIQVTIGRIEVRTGPPSPPSKKVATPAATLSLREYLRQRSGRSRE